MYYLFAWLIIGCLSFVIGDYFINDEITVSTLFVGLVASILGLFLMLAVIFYLDDKFGFMNKIIIRRKK